MLEHRACCAACYAVARVVRVVLLHGHGLDGDFAGVVELFPFIELVFIVKLVLDVIDVLVAVALVR